MVRLRAICLSSWIKVSTPILSLRSASTAACTGGEVRNTNDQTQQGCFDYLSSVLFLYSHILTTILEHMYIRQERKKAKRPKKRKRENVPSPPPRSPTRNNPTALTPLSRPPRRIVYRSSPDLRAFLECPGRRRYRAWPGRGGLPHCWPGRGRRQRGARGRGQRSRRLLFIMYYDTYLCIIIVYFFL